MLYVDNVCMFTDRSKTRVPITSSLDCLYTANIFLKKVFAGNYK